MSVTLYSPEGTPLSGEATPSAYMKARCDEVGGYVLDDQTGDRVYPKES